MIRISQRLVRTSRYGNRGLIHSLIRPGFEVRTYRLCQRVLMFHHFEGEANVGQIVWFDQRTSLSQPQDPNDPLNPSFFLLQYLNLDRAFIANLAPCAISAGEDSNYRRIRTRRKRCYMRMAWLSIDCVSFGGHGVWAKRCASLRIVFAEDF